MPHYEHSVRIDASAGRVWDVLSDIERWPELTASIDSVEPLDGDSVTVGHRFRVRQPKLTTAVWTVTEVHEGTSFVWESRSGGVLTRAGHVLRQEGEDKGEGEGVTMTLTIDQSGLL